MKGNQQRPRRKDGKQSLELVFRDGKVDLDLREGHQQILKMKDQKFKSINEVLDILNKKL